ncbi:MAG: lytic transglycosylase domain-containing protein [Marmoricola sp.]
MPSPSFSLKSKALTIIPVALLSGAWTASLVNVSSVTAAQASGDHNHKLPGGVKIPTQAIQTPASIPEPDRIAPGVPKGSVDSVVSGASTSGIPSAALAAYQRGARIIDAADKSCNIPWELIAAIGRVESNHGRFGGSSLNSKGIDTPPVYGPLLDGKNGTQAIMDTDAGQLDGNSRYDRAVGPMQFLPSTWEVVKVDADGDGQRNPQDINDAALATGVYLCSGSENLANRPGQQAAVYRYNHSHQYVDLVLRIMEAYSSGDYTAVPSSSYGGNLYSPSSSGAITEQRHLAKLGRMHGGGGKAHGAHHGHASGGSSHGSTSSSSGGSTSGGSGGSSSGSGGGLLGSGGGNSGGSGGGGLLGGGSGSGSGSGAVTKPVVKTLDQLGTTSSYCTSQLQGAGLSGVLLNTALPKCVARVGSMTETEAASTIPNTLKGVLDWLGLGGLLNGLGG